MTNSETDDKYVTQSQFGMFIEQMNSQFNRVLEALDTMLDVPPQVNKLSEDMQEVKADLKTIKAVQRD